MRYVFVIYTSCYINVMYLNSLKTFVSINNDFYSKRHFEIFSHGLIGVIKVFGKYLKILTRRITYPFSPSNSRTNEKILSSARATEYSPYTNEFSRRNVVKFLYNVNNESPDALCNCKNIHCFVTVCFRNQNYH